MNPRLRRATIAVLSFLFIAEWVSAQGVLHLTEGQNVSYSFSTVPFTQSGALVSPAGFALFHMGDNNDGVSAVRMEMFENGVGQNLVGIGTNSSWGVASPVELHISNTWQDLNGSMRLTVLTGSADVTGFEVNVFGGPTAPGQFNNLWGYGVVIPVSEPTSILLTALGVAVFLFRRRARR